MLTVPCSLAGRKYGNNDLGLEPPGNTHCITLQHLSRPARKRLVEGARVTEIIGSSEVLSPVLERSGRQQFSRSNHTQLGAQFSSDQILATLPP
jgi:hypothetical protein